MARWIVGIKIATLGDGALEAAATLTDARYRLATGVPPWDTHDVYRDALASLPQSISTDVDWLEGKCTVSGLTARLLGTDEVYGWLLRPAFARLTTLAAALDASTTTVVLNASGLGGRTVTVGREAIRLGTTITGTGPYSYLGSTRGVLSTRAYPHGDDNTDDTEVFAAGAAPLGLLPVEVFRVPTTGGYADEEVIYRGVLASVRWSRGEVEAQIDSALGVVMESMICRDLFRARKRRTSLYSGDPGSAPASDTPTTTALFTDGDRAIVGTVKNAGGGIIYVGAANNAINPGFVAAWAGSTPVTPEGGSNELGDEIWQFFSTYYLAPAVNGAGDQLDANALTHLLQILTTTADGGNGAYDLGVAVLGVGIPEALIDVAQIERLRESRGAALELRTLHYPLDGRPVAVSDLVGWLLRPFGLALIQGAGGLLQVRALEDGQGGAYTLGVEALIEPPDLTWAGRPVDEVTISLAEIPGQGTVEQLFSDIFTRERNLSGTAAGLEIDARGVEDPSVARLLGIGWVSRWRWAIPVLRVVTTRALDAWPGDEVTVTLPAVPGRAGARGWTEEVCVVSSREVDLATGEHRYDLWWTSAVYNRTGRIGPAARVASYSAPTLTVDADTFAPAGYAESDAAIWEELLAESGTILRCLILDSDLSVRGTTRVIGANGGANTLTLNSATVSPVAGDVIVLAAYDGWGTATERNYLHARYAYLADANDTVGSAGDDPYEWEG